MKTTMAIALLIGVLLMMTGTTMIADVDTEAPQLVGLEVFPKAVNIGMVPGRVTARAHVTDDLSGVAHIQISMLHEDGSHGYGLVMFGIDVISRTNTDGIWEGAFTIPQFMAPTQIFATWVRMEDIAGNTRVLKTEDLGDFDTIVVVTNVVEKLYIPLVTIADVD